MRSSKALTLATAGAALTLDILVTSGSFLGGPGGEPDLRTVMSHAMSEGPLIAHWLVVAGLSAACLHWRARFARAPGVALLLVLMALLGPMGTLVGFLAALVAALTPTADLSTDREEQGAGWASAGHGGEPGGKGVALEPEPLADVFRRGTLAQRRNAVALIAANFRPPFAQALRMALADENNAIRVQAGLVMQQLEDEFDQRQAELESHLDDTLARHGFGASDGWLSLARLHDEHAYTGLLDEERARRAHSEALRAYRHHLASDPDDVSVIAAVGRLLIRAGQHRLVADWLHEQIAQGRTSASVLMWYAEALYRAGRYPALRQMLAQHGEQITSHLPPDSPFRAVLALWRP